MGPAFLEVAACLPAVGKQKMNSLLCFALLVHTASAFLTNCPYLNQ